MSRDEQSRKNVEKKTIGKRFSHRNSLLIDLFENIHVRTIYHLFIAIFIGLFVNTAAYDYLKNGEVTLGLKLIKLGFAKIHIALLGWIGYFSLSCFMYLCFYLWATFRNSLPKLQLQRIWDIFWLLVLVAYYFFSFQSSAKFVTNFKLPPASSGIVIIEQTRCVMKIHSFIRSNSPKVLHYKPHSDVKLILPTFSYFFYFMFIPTFIYQDSYPRTKKINWQFVFFRIIEIIGGLFFFSFIIDRFLNPSIRDIGIRKYTINEIILCIFENTITGILILLPTFFLVLHSWQNLFAELTRFGDRLFYSDWWTCTDFSGYFRKWNIIVQDWLYVYVYKEFHENIFPKSTVLPKLAVFIISAFVHEWILTYMFGFFFPLIFIEFLVFGSILNFIVVPKTPLFNILFWYILAFGMSTLVTMYGFEFCARINVPITNPSLKDFFIPRLLTCDCIDYR